VSARERALRSWSFRWAVEREAERAFARLAGELRALGYPEELARECMRVSEDEALHIQLCAKLTKELGGEGPADLPIREKLAPASLGREDALAYDLVARCCVAETESTATLVELLPQSGAQVRDVVHTIAEDEVRHSRLGWQFLAYVAPKRDLTFLGPLIPAMLETGGGPLFQPIEEDDVPELGVFGRPTQLRLFRETLLGVILPGFELHGIPTGPAREWLAAKERAASESNS
jgi:hypothetical protein